MNPGGNREFSFSICNPHPLVGPIHWLPLQNLLIIILSTPYGFFLPHRWLLLHRRFRGEGLAPRGGHELLIPLWTGERTLSMCYMAQPFHPPLFHRNRRLVLSAGPSPPHHIKKGPHYCSYLHSFPFPDRSNNSLHSSLVQPQRSGRKPRNSSSSSFPFISGRIEVQAI